MRAEFALKLGGMSVATVKKSCRWQVFSQSLGATCCGLVPTGIKSRDLKSIKKRAIKLVLVLVAGLEPARYCYRGILSPLRLPFRHTSKILEVPPRLELGIRVLQTLALPLGEGTKVSKRKI